jgi:hypothetical protein
LTHSISPSDPPGEPSEIDVFELAKQIKVKFPSADELTVVDMLLRLALNEKAVCDILEGPISTSQLSPLTQQPKQKGMKKGANKKLPGEQNARVKFINQRLVASGHFQDRTEGAVLQFARVLASPTQFCESYFKLDGQDGDSNGDTWRVKVILTTMNISKFWRTVGKLATWKWGMVHAALLVGPFVIDWGPKSVVIPDEIEDFSLENAVLALDVGEIDGTMSHANKNKIMNLCRRIVQWNIGPRVCLAALFFFLPHGTLTASLF